MRIAPRWLMPVLALVLGGRAGVSAVRMGVLAPLPSSLRIVRTKV